MPKYWDLPHMVSSRHSVMPVRRCEGERLQAICMCGRVWPGVGIKTQHQCRHSNWSIALERVPVQPIPYASEPETTKPAQFRAKPWRKYPLHLEKRVAATDNHVGSRSSTVQCSSDPRSTQVQMVTVSKYRKCPGLRCLLGIEPDSGGERYQKGDEYPNAPLVCA